MNATVVELELFERGENKVVSVIIRGHMSEAVETAHRVGSLLLGEKRWRIKAAKYTISPDEPLVSAGTTQFHLEQF
jgi:hypothetical protein